MNRVLIITIYIATFLFAGEYTLYADASNHLVGGPKSLLAVCQCLGIRAELVELIRLSSGDETDVDMPDLCKAAQAIGLHVANIKISAADLAKLKLLAIALQWDNHFVVVENVGINMLKITDPPAEPKMMSVKEFSDLYSGCALLISKDKSLFPVHTKKRPDLRLDAYTLDLGVLNEGEKKEAILSLRNAGNKELEISQVRSTCGCTVALISDKNIKSGGAGELKITFDSTGRQGIWGEKVYIQSNDMVTPLVQVQVIGTVQSSRLLLSPRSIVIRRNIRRGESASRQIYLFNDTGKDLQVKEVKADIPFIETGIKKQAEGEGSYFIITVTLKPGAPLGTLKSKVTVFTNHPKEPVVEIPVTAEIVGDIKIQPDTLFFGMLKKNGEAEASVILCTVGNKPFVIKQIISSLDYISVVAAPVMDGHKIIATLKKNAPAGNIKGEVIVYTDSPDQPQIKIPVYAYVED